MRNRSLLGFDKGLAILLMLCLSLCFHSLASGAGTTIVSVSPLSQRVDPGEQFSISVVVDPNTAIAGVQFNLSFDASLVSANRVEEGNLLKQGGASTYFGPGQIDNVAGTITGVYGVIITPGQAVSTSGTFAIITLTAKTGGGACALTLSNVVVGDMNGNAVPASVVNGTISVNKPPVLNPIGGKSVNEGQLLTFTISATDPDGDSLTYSASNLPQGASFQAQTRTFSWTPGYNQAGVYTNIHFQVSDGSLTDSEDITITVNNVNRPPVLDLIGNKAINEGQLLTFTISATDPDGDSLTYSASNLPDGASFDPETQTFSWTPGYGQAGVYPNVRFEVSDGTFTDSEEITITVIHVNRPPMLSPIGPKTVDAGEALVFTTSAVDLDGDALTYSASNLPDGAVFDPGSGTFSWTPGYDQAGVYPNVRFQVSDGTFTDSEEITITVNHVNRPPVLSPIGPKTVDEGEALVFTTSATDPNGDALTYSASNLPDGAIFDSGSGTFSWTPGYGQAGVYPNVRFEVSDGTSTVSEEITITVNHVNRPPVLSLIMTVDEGEALVFTISATDPNGDALTYSASNLPSGASFNPGSRTFSWTPGYDQAGVYPNVCFEVSDGTSTVSEEMTITVNDVNQPPVLNAIGPKTVDEGKLLAFIISANDPEGDTLIYSAHNLPDGASFDPESQTFSWTPGYDQAGVYFNIRFEVSDGTSAASEEITIAVNHADTNSLGPAVSTEDEGTITQPMLPLSGILPMLLLLLIPATIVEGSLVYLLIRIRRR
jgi:hypothetical protein